MEELVSVSESFSPIRMVAGQRDPSILNVTVKNKSKDSVIATVIAKIPFSLGFDRIGLEREARRRIGFVKPESEKVVPIPIHLKVSAGEGVYPIDVRVQLHKDRYDKVEKELRTTAELRVISR
ncbi:MAG: hypothetical protein V1911_01705 [Candidatus Micrarchaeota archaeon]